MNVLYKAYCRIYQKVMKLAAGFLPWKEAEILQGAGSINKLPAVLKKHGITHVMLVTDPGLVKIGLHQGLLEALEAADIPCSLYAGALPNPTVDMVETGLKQYLEEKCDGLIALGGGSAMDCAKGIGMRVARPNRTIEQMKGTLHVGKKLPLLVTIPTTAGTGSEVTLAAVITDAKTKDKFAIMDPHLMPPVVVLDANMTVGLPPFVTATTGMDALTHAVEAYIGHSNTEDTRKYAIQTVQLVMANLEEAYAHGDNLKARENMQYAAYCGGKAFTRAYVGYVHAIAHSLGGFLGVPHGLANAVAMPYVLDAYGEHAWKSLAQLSDCVKLTDPSCSEEEKAKAFIQKIRTMNKDMDIPTKIDKLTEAEIPPMVQHSLKEGNPLYPVPEIWGEEEFTKIYRQLLPEEKSL